MVSLAVSQRHFQPATKRPQFKKHPVVMVCRSGQRSVKASKMAKSKGNQNMSNLSGGMLSWNGVRSSK